MKIKLLIIISLLLSLNKLYAEKLHSFYLHELDTSEYPIVKIKGAVYLDHESLTIENKFLELYENNSLIKNYTLNIKDLRLNIKIIEITYKSQNNKISSRNLCIKYVDNSSGLHNRIGFYSDMLNYSGYVDEDDYIYENYNFKNDELQDLNNVECWDVSTINYLAKITRKYYHNNKTEKKYVLASNGLNIRKQPTRTSEIIGKLKNGEQCTISLKTYGKKLEIKESFDFKIEGEFRRIKHNNQAGYIFDGYLSDFYIFDKEKQTVEQYINSIIKGIQPINCLDSENNQIKKIENKLTYNKLTNTYSLRVDKYTDQREYLIIQSLFGDLKKYSLNIEKIKSYIKVYNFKNVLGETDFKISYNNNEGIQIIWKPN